MEIWIPQSSRAGRRAGLPRLSLRRMGEWLARIWADDGTSERFARERLYHDQLTLRVR